MAAISDSDVKYEDMLSSDLVKELKKIVSVLEKKTKKMETTVAKVEEKKAKAAPAKGVVPPHLEHNLAWVEFVWEHVLANGWEEFTHSERLGAQMVVTTYSCSEIQEAKIDGETIMLHAFVDSNHLQPSRAQAMTLSKLYRTTRTDLYEQFLEENPVPEAQAKAKPVAAPRLSMTMAEVKAAREEAKAVKEAEKAEKKAQKEAEKAAAKAQKEAEKEAKAMAKLPKIPKAAIIRKIIPVKAAGAEPKVISKPLVKPAMDVWVAPKEGTSNKWMVPTTGTMYWRDHKDRLYLVQDDSDEIGECIGVWTGKMIDDDIPEDE